jgi:hypothetical protein
MMGSALSFARAVFSNLMDIFLRLPAFLAATEFPFPKEFSHRGRSRRLQAAGTEERVFAACASLHRNKRPGDSCRAFAIV